MKRIVRTVTVVLFIAVTASACIVQQPQQPPQQVYATPSPGAQPAVAAPLPPVGPRTLSFNGHAATASDLQILEQLEARWRVRLPDGAYWYDNLSGAAGPWGGPTGGLIPAGLGIGGALPASASGGGDGSLTGVFINGRELHPQDVANLQAMLGQVYQGDWFVDAYGNFGQQGGPVLGNLVQIAEAYRKQNGSGGDSYYRKDDNGSAFVGGGCVSISTKSSPSSDAPDIDYYSAGC